MMAILLMWSAVASVVVALFAILGCCHAAKLADEASERMVRKANLEASHDDCGDR